jgi:hypothetical protein
MPLALLAKDSMINLAEMAQKKDDEEEGGSSRADGVEGIYNLPQYNPMETPEEMADAARQLEDALAVRDSLPGLVGSDVDVDADVDVEESASFVSSNGSSFVSSHGSEGSGSAATSIEKQSASAISLSQGQYAGFGLDYHDYQHYDYSGGYATGWSKNQVPTLLGGQKKKNSMFCLCFPWLSSKDDLEDENSEQEPESLISVKKEEKESLSRSASGEDDEVSTGSSDVFGEKLSDKDRQAVLARLRLAQPDAALGTTTPSTTATTEQAKPKNENKLLSGIVNGEENKDKPVKGILKHSSKTWVSDSSQKPPKADVPNGNSRRRSLFPQYEKNEKPKKDLIAKFSPMARVVTVRSQKEMTQEEKGNVWWQKPDYEEFRKTGRMITRAMLEGGSEIWLASNQSWHQKGQNRASTLQQALSISDRQKQIRNGNLQAKHEYEAVRDKWWHKFGHSRRGLEHIASIDEGRQRQAKVRIAIRAVLDAQRKQKAFHREDADKLRMVSIQDTSWARDLALASAHSDADAVQTDFDERKRKSREFYLLKFFKTLQNGTNATTENVPAFMQQPLKRPVNSSRLDVNTSQVRYRTKKQKNGVAPAPQQSMAKMAAGFTVSGEEVASMSAVLTGMGMLPKGAATVGVGGP